jgi:hypothetical protein
MGQFSAEKPVLPGSVLSGSKQPDLSPGRDIPNPYRFIFGPGHNAHAVGTEYHTRNFAADLQHTCQSATLWSDERIRDAYLGGEQTGAGI